MALLLGRKTYDIWEAYWPRHADIWPGVNNVTKYVASRNESLKLGWENSMLLSGYAAGAVRRLKYEEGPDLHVWGSSNLIQTLLLHDLVDELWLFIYPLTLGPGKRLFAEGAIPAAFKLTEGKVSPSGVFAVKYVREGEVKAGIAHSN